MEMLNEYIGIIGLTGAIIIIIVLLINLGVQLKVSKYFSNAKFLIRTSVEYHLEKGNHIYKLKVHNHNINDVRVTSFGFLYKNQNIDYYQKYLLENNLPLENKIVIFSRDHLVMTIEPEVLKSIILDINKGETKVKKIKIFVVDSLGLTTHYKTKNILKHLKSIIKESVMQNRLNILTQKKKINDEIKEQKQIIRKERAFKRREKIQGTWLRIKGIFKKKNK